MKFQASIHLYTCTAQFVSDLVGNPEDRHSQDMANLGQKNMCASGYISQKIRVGRSLLFFLFSLI